jgi:hypothetical protein
LEEKKGILGMRFTELEYILIFIECASSLFVFYFLYKFLHVHSVPACMMMHVGVAEESAVNNPQFSATVLSLSLSVFFLWWVVHTDLHFGKFHLLLYMDHIDLQFLCSFSDIQI